jgi:diadenosine tetraphosphatase ApaH/serine/threonine PP2A family protein phosphatase
MRIALLADLHGNLDALEACLAHASAQRADRFAFLGDLVGYGPDPGAVVDAVAAHVQRGAVAVRGNHDEAIANGAPAFEDEAWKAVEWSRAVLSTAQQAFLGSLPLTAREEEMFFVHASAVEPSRWQYIDSSAAARESIDAAGTVYTFSGHVHDQVLYFKTLAGKTAPFRPVSGSIVPVPSHRGWLAIAGSVGQPRDGNPAAAYAVFDSTAEEITFFRVPYDYRAVAEKVRRAGLPELLALRLEQAS